MRLSQPEIVRCWGPRRSHIRESGRGRVGCDDAHCPALPRDPKVGRREWGWRSEWYCGAERCVPRRWFRPVAGAASAERLTPVKREAVVAAMCRSSRRSFVPSEPNEFVVERAEVLRELGIQPDALDADKIDAVVETLGGQLMSVPTPRSQGLRAGRRVAAGRPSVRMYAVAEWLCPGEANEP